MEKKKTLGVNSFGLVKELPERLEETLQELRKMGITSLEPDLIAIDRNRTLQRWLSELEAKVPGRNITPKNVWTLDQTEGYLPVIKEAGLGVFACHLFHVMMHPGALKEMLPEVIRFAEQTGIRCYVVSYMLGSKESADTYLDEINEAVELLDQYGIALAYHNHEMEYNKIDGGDETVMDYLLRQGDPRLKVEFDIGWCYLAGVDAVAFMRRYRDRIIALHLKDFAGREFAAIGEGDVPLKEVLEQARKENLPLLEEGIIMDQDEAKDDMLEALRVGSAHALEWLDE